MTSSKEYCTRQEKKDKKNKQKNTKKYNKAKYQKLLMSIKHYPTLSKKWIRERTVKE